MLLRSRAIEVTFLRGDTGRVLFENSYSRLHILTLPWLAPEATRLPSTLSIENTSKLDFVAT